MQFYFNVYDGKHLLDDEGIEFDSVDEARVAAVRLAGAILKDDASKIAFGTDWHMEVMDQAGTALFRIDFGVQAAAATAERRLRSV